MASKQDHRAQEVLRVDYLVINPLYEMFVLLVLPLGAGVFVVSSPGSTGTLEMVA